MNKLISFQEKKRAVEAREMLLNWWNGKTLSQQRELHLFSNVNMIEMKDLKLKNVYKRVVQLVSLLLLFSKLFFCVCAKPSPPLGV